MKVSSRMKSILIIMGVIALPLIAFFIFALTKGLKNQYKDEEMIVHERTINLSGIIGSILTDRLSALEHIGLAYRDASSDIQIRNQIIGHFFI